MPDDAHSSSDCREPDRKQLFSTTRWSVIFQAGSLDSSHRRPALETFCQSYWFPIYAHIRRSGIQPYDAQDLTQGFFAHVLERSPFLELSPEKGRFRSFLLTALKNYMSDQRERQHAAKRGGGQPLISLDEVAAEERYGLEPVTTLTPEKIFDRDWAMAVLERAIESLAHEQEMAGKKTLFERLQIFLTAPTDSGDYTGAAADLDIPANTVAVMVRRLRQRYRELVREEIAATLANPEDVEAEMGYLLAALHPT